MPRPLSQDIRERFISYITSGYSARETARRLKIAPSTGVKWAQHYKCSGHLNAAPMGRPKGSTKIAEFEKFILEILSQDADLTLREISDALTDAHGVRSNVSGIWRFLKSRGMSHKKSL